MKKTLLLSLSLLVACTAFAQLENYTNAPQFTGVTITGDNFDLYKTLDSGKTVIIDAMATWCPPCWSWHEGNYFKDLNAAYGPNGTDEIRMVMIEADSRTPESLLYTAANGGSAATTSLGDWVTGIDYAIINDDNFNTLYDIAFFPTIYAITPNRMVYEIGRFQDVSVYQDWHLNNPGLATADVNGKLLQYTGITNVCGESADAEVRFQNHSTEPLTEDFMLTVSANGAMVAQQMVTQDFDAYEIAKINIGALPAELTDATLTDITVTATVASDIDATDDELMATIGSAASTSDLFTLNFTTDFYPVETSWTLRDAAGDIVLSETYTGVAAGGGANANKLFTYTFNPASTDLSCYSFVVFDSYGDGMFRTAATQLNPGVELLDEDGNVVFVNEFGAEFGLTFEDDYSVPVALAAETVSSTTAPIANGLNVYPNPAQKNGTVVIELDQLNTSELISATLTNALGQTLHVYQPQAASSQLSFNLPQEVTGVVFLELNTNDASSIVRLMVD
ncbi:MAG: T9SS type A sorting domain-containing protein [Saprospiraceae bacterium]